MRPLFGIFPKKYYLCNTNQQIKQVTYESITLSYVGKETSTKSNDNKHFSIFAEVLIFFYFDDYWCIFVTRLLLVLKNIL